MTNRIFFKLLGAFLLVIAVATLTLDFSVRKAWEESLYNEIRASLEQKATLFAQAVRRKTTSVLRSASSGWRNNPSQPAQTCFRGQAGETSVEYRFQRGGVWLAVDGTELPGVRFKLIWPEQVAMEVGGVGRIYNVHHAGDTFYVDSPLGASALVELPRFPIPQEQVVAGSLVAPLPGVVSEIKVRPGDKVSAGDVVLVIDSMKVFHWISAPHEGRVAEIYVEAGNHVESGTVLAVIE